ncbi:hypothetical protein ACSBR2_029715 [Camellia fascicularis]
MTSLHTCQEVKTFIHAYLHGPLQYYNTINIQSNTQPLFWLILLLLPRLHLLVAFLLSLSLIKKALQTLAFFILFSSFPARIYCPADVVVGTSWEVVEEMSNGS